ncbi:MAG: hypothetical protein OXK79_06700 [Chloroflexota bacterium]|nr:hypothetical protein [Chloroflexota bacterium]
MFDAEGEVVFRQRTSVLLSVWEVGERSVIPRKGISRMKLDGEHRRALEDGAWPYARGCSALRG